MYEDLPAMCNDRIKKKIESVDKLQGLLILPKNDECCDVFLINNTGLKIAMFITQGEDVGFFDGCVHTFKIGLHAYMAMYSSHALEYGKPLNLPACTLIDAEKASDLIYGGVFIIRTTLANMESAEYQPLTEKHMKELLEAIKIKGHLKVR